MLSNPIKVRATLNYYRSSAAYIANLNQAQVTKSAAHAGSLLKAVSHGVFIRTGAENPALKTASHDLTIPVTIGNTGAPWILGLSAPIDVMFAETEHQRNIALLLMAISIIVVSAVLGIIFTRKVLRPIGANRQKRHASRCPLPLARCPLPNG
ncbi:MAG: hypothetical protein ACR5LD_06035 [Symbiopectobacterium sp.]